MTLAAADREGPVGADVTPNPEPEALGRMVRRLRLEADLTLERLSEASGISDRALSDIERGAALGPRHRTVLAIAAALGLTEAERVVIVRAAREGRRRALPSSLCSLPLPPDVDDFVGRQAELQSITNGLTSARSHRAAVVVVTGPPGYGKTTLAVRAAALLRDTFSDQLFLHLDGLTPDPPSGEALVRRLVRALTPHSRADGDAGLVRRLLGDRRPLLVLDDAAFESQVRPLLHAVGRATVLVTSRRSLAGLDGTHRVPLDRLPGHDAQRLLAAVIPRKQGVGADLEGLARLCDHVPLALRIAGNRLASRPSWTVTELAARLAPPDRRLHALTAGDTGMTTAIDPSFARLGPVAQRLLRRLGLVDGATFGVELASALMGQEPWVVEGLLDELADANLVEPLPRARYTLHQLLRLYAMAELAHEPKAVRAAVRTAADEWLVGTAAGVASGFRPGLGAAPSVARGATSAVKHGELAPAWLADEADNWGAAVVRVLRANRGVFPRELVEAAWWLRRLVPAGASVPGGRTTRQLALRR